MMVELLCKRFIWWAARSWRCVSIDVTGYGTASREEGLQSLADGQNCCLFPLQSFCCLMVEEQSS